MGLCELEGVLGDVRAPKRRREDRCVNVSYRGVRGVVGG